MNFVAIVDNQRLILAIHVPEHFVVNGEDLISLPLKAEIGEVLAPVDPVSDGPLYAQHDRYQDFLDHFGVLNAFRIPQHLFDRAAEHGTTPRPAATTDAMSSASGG